MNDNNYDYLIKPILVQMGMGVKTQDIGRPPRVTVYDGDDIGWPALIVHNKALTVMVELVHNSHMRHYECPFSPAEVVGTVERLFVRLAPIYKHPPLWKLMANRIGAIASYNGDFPITFTVCYRLFGFVETSIFPMKPRNLPSSVFRNLKNTLMLPSDPLKDSVGIEKALHETNTMSLLCNAYGALTANIEDCLYLMD